MHDHPLAAEPLAGFEVAEQIAVDAVAHMRRDLGDVDGGHGVDADVDAVLLAGFADAGDALVGERLDGVRRHVDLQVDVADAVLDGDGDALLDPRSLADIHADAVAQVHSGPSRIRFNVR